MAECLTEKENVGKVFVFTPPSFDTTQITLEKGEN